MCDQYAAKAFVLQRSSFSNNPSQRLEVLSYNISLSILRLACAHSTLDVKPPLSDVDSDDALNVESGTSIERCGGVQVPRSNFNDSKVSPRMTSYVSGIIKPNILRIQRESVMQKSGMKYQEQILYRQRHIDIGIETLALQ